jgi:hypothetical protein
MNRFGAFAIHLGISLLIFLLLSYLIVFHWYPDFFFTTDGGWQGIRIVALVDLVLGPLLTLCVYRHGKPGLRTDLTLIGVFQISCLLAGTYVVYSERPIAIVYAAGFFHSMSAEDYQRVGQPVPELDHLPGPSPKWVSVVLPEDVTAELAVRKQALQARIPLRTLSEYYVPFATSHIDMQQDPFPLPSIEQERPEELAAFIAQHGGLPNNYLFFQLGTRYEFALMVFRKADLSFAGTMLLAPVPSETTAEAGATAG